MKDPITPCLLRMARNLEQAPLTDVLAAASMSLEAARELAVGLMKVHGRSALDVELFDATLKPVIRELMQRQIELGNHDLFVQQLDAATLRMFRGERGHA